MKGNRKPFGKDGDWGNRGGDINQLISAMI